MLTVQYSGPERVINQTVWLPDETRPATPRQLTAWRAEHGDVFAVVGAQEPPTSESTATVVIADDEAVQTTKARRK